MEQTFETFSEPETWMPKQELRWLTHPGDVFKPVLQQRWYCLSGESRGQYEWKDVPFTDGEGKD